MTSSAISEELIALRRRARQRLVGAVVLTLVALIVLWNVLDAQPKSVQSTPPTPVQIVSSAPSLAGVPAVTPYAVPTPPVHGIKLVDPALPAPHAEVLQPSGQLGMPEPEPEPAPDFSALPATGQLSPPVNPTPASAAPAPSPTKATPAKAKEPAASTEKPPQKAKPAAAAPEDPIMAVATQNKAPKPDTPDPAAATPRPQATKGKFSVQLAALADTSKAQLMASKARDMGINAHTETMTGPNGQLTRVRVGPFANRAEADAARQKLAAAGISGVIVGH
jgi:DedD protein